MKYLVQNYESILNTMDTQIAIKLIKDTFEEKLARNLCLTRVSAPLFVDPTTGLNDNLNGVEKAISFKVASHDSLEIVQSLAKWKRYALKKYEFDLHKGLYTDMNAIRPEEELDNLHSYYVDQWDWEMVISDSDRNLDFLKKVVKKIYEAFLETYDVLIKSYPVLKTNLSKEVFFITSQELEDMYPELSPKERENKICKKYGCVFLIGIGDKLRSGKSHDGRSSDYDDWCLNGDLLLWYDVLGCAFELSSMGIRVNKDSLVRQIKIKGEEEKLELMYHKAILNDELPLTIGGGIGQSRICMYLLKKAHIGEVQASFWSEDEIERCENENIKLL